MTEPKPTPVDRNPYIEVGTILADVYLNITGIAEGTSEVMNALIPPGHDVYDTRTHVAVPVETIREAADSLQKIASGSITGNNHAHRPWAQKRADALRSLLPTDESAGDDDAN